MMYNYLEAIIEDVKEAIKEYDTTEFADREEFEERLNDELWNTDSVTGNASGSYHCNSNKSMECVLDNMDLLEEMCTEFCIDSATIGEKFINEEWEWMDVSIRCYLLGQAISEALDDMEDELTFEEE